MRLRLLLWFALLARVLPCLAQAPKPIALAGPHTNGLGMRFVPVEGTKVHFSIYETRVRDFRAFVRESGYVHMRETADENSRMWSLDKDGHKQRGHSWENPAFKQTEEHPVVGVSWDDARAFCEWLTAREQAAGRLTAGWKYRLPTDHEWSVAVGLKEDAKKTPEEKDGKIKDRYPWGQWPEGLPPPAGAGNYAGAEVDDGHWPKNFVTIEGYDDAHVRTAPVRSFKPNEFEIYNLGGNVWEWCEEERWPGAGSRVLRGASWSDHSHIGLLSRRRFDLPGDRYDDIGFRCVVGTSSP